MKKKLFILVALFSLLCGACSMKGEKHDLSDYISELEYHDGFKIMQLSDLHFSSYDDLDEDFKFMDLLFNEQQDLDLFVVSGDLFTFASKGTVRSVLDYFNSKDIPFIITYGNHDEQVYASYTYVSEYATTLSNCLLRYYDDDLTGLSNNVINLKKNNEVQYQIYIMDSNSYIFVGEDGYNYVHEDQINWYKENIELANKERYGTNWKVGDTTIPSLIYQHIPLPEMKEAIEAYNEDNSIGEGTQNEPTSPPKYNSGFFEVIKEYGSSKAIFFGHDHVNSLKVNYEGIDMVYGIKSTDNMYHNDDLLGYRLTTINNVNEYTTSIHLHSYSEVK